MVEHPLIECHVDRVEGAGGSGSGLCCFGGCPRAALPADLHVSRRNCLPVATLGFRERKAPLDRQLEAACQSKKAPNSASRWLGLCPRSLAAVAARPLGAAPGRWAMIGHCTCRAFSLVLEGLTACRRLGRTSATATCRALNPKPQTPITLYPKTL